MHFNRLATTGLTLVMLIVCVGCNSSKTTKDTGPERELSDTGGSTSKAVEGAAQQTSFADNGVVYVRVPRAHDLIHIMVSDNFKSSLTGEPLDPSFLDTLPEVSYILSGFNAPGQLVWRQKDGTETVIFDCVDGMPAENVVPPIQNEDDVCVPMDPSVSFDGTRVAFSVYHGEYNKQRDLHNQQSGEVGKLATPTWAGIYIYNFETGRLTHWPHQQGVWDTAPVWLPDGKMMFTSTRSNIYKRQVLSTQRRPVLQLWVANRDGSNAHQVSYNQENTLHPFVHSSGRVLFSRHEIPYSRVFHRRGHYSETVHNLWWLMSTDLRGGNLNAHLRAHDSHINHLPPGERDRKLTAPHFIGERSNGEVCTDVYYRRNNFGSGMIVCWPPDQAGIDPLGHEGPYPFNITDGLYVAVDGDDGDSGGIHPHVRDPAGAPDNVLLFAGGIGDDSACHWGGKLVELTQKYLENEPGGATCDIGIYSTVESLMGSDSDANLIVNDPEWHEFMPRAVASYKAIYGMSEPQQPPLSNTDSNDESYGVFASVNTAKGNVRTASGWNGPGVPFWCHFQGCALQAFITHDESDNYDTIDDIAAMRFWKVIPNDQPVHYYYNPMWNVWGQKLVLMGDVPVESDGSFKAKLPADVPFLMAGVDAQGRSMARHQNVMSLRPGEKQVCAGCHLHATTDTQNAQFPFSQTIAFGKPPVAPQNGRNSPLEWTTDIYPMLQNNCASCHDGGNSAPEPNFAASSNDLYLELTNKGVKTLSYPPSFALTDDGETHAAVPWVTRYVNVLFARESLLYWKAAGQRMDGRTDNDLSNDFDFGDAHASYLTANQLKKLADWMEAGLYCANGCK